MSKKNTKRQRTLEDMIGSSSTKKKKENIDDDDRPIDEKKNLVNNSSKHTDNKGDGIYIIFL